MLENIIAAIDSREIETYHLSSVHIIRKVLDLIKNNPTLVVQSDLSDFPLPRMTLHTQAILDNCVVKIQISANLKDEDIRISLSDASLPPGTPPAESFSYRVNILGRETAEKYKGSTGYNFAQTMFEKVQKDGNPLIISDNWAETTLTPEEALNLLGNIQHLNLPDYDPRELTEFGTPRYTPLAI